MPVSLLLARLAKLPSQCNSTGSGNLGNLGSNKEIQPLFPRTTVCYICLLPAGRCWIGLGLNPTGVEFRGSAGGLSDHA